VRDLLPRIPPAVARKLAHYVYIYVDPRDNSVFYVGKGQNGRALAHLKSEHGRMATRLGKLRAAGVKRRIEILAHDLPDAATALRIEAAAIDLLGVGNLVNAVRGQGGSRMPLDDVIAHYTRRPAVIREPSLLIRISQLYRAGMSDQDLYDATRSAWVVAESRRKNVKLAFSVYEDVVREVYQITGWLPGGSTFNAAADARRRRMRVGRWEFVGVKAPERIRKKYVGRYVGDHFRRGGRNPVRYIVTA
jgi:uncharacterized protein